MSHSTPDILAVTLTVPRTDNGGETRLEIVGSWFPAVLLEQDTPFTPTDERQVEVVRAAETAMVELYKMLRDLVPEAEDDSA